MKKLLISLILFISLFSMTACLAPDEPVEDCVRIHIRANSNDEIDQKVKLVVRDAVIEYLTPLLANCENKEDAKQTLTDSIPSLTAIANQCLFINSFSYKANVELRREKFPYRKYLDYSFPDGYYDALIIELGHAEGNNWWCVCFPPLCFVPSEDDGDNFRYKSKIHEIIKKSRG